MAAPLVVAYENDGHSGKYRIFRCSRTMREEVERHGTYVSAMLGIEAIREREAKAEKDLLRMFNHGKK